MSSADLQFNKLLQFVTSPEGAILVLVGAVLAMIGSQKPIIAWGFLVVATLTAALTQSATFADALKEAETAILLAPGLAQIQSYGRVIAIAGMLGTLPYLLTTPGSPLRISGVRPLNLLFAMLHVALIIKMLEYRLTSYAAFSAAIYALMFFIFGIRQTTWTPDWGSMIWPIRVIAAAAGLFILGVMYQATVNVGIMTSNGGRLQGLTANPQHAATLLAAGFPAICCLWELDRHNRLTEWGYLALLGLAVVLVAWTSSRTGGLMCAVSLAAMYRRQLRKLAIIAMLCVAAVLGAAQYSSDIADTADMMTRTDDTRSAVWAGQLKEFLKHPVTGSPADGSNRLGIAENSWLAAASTMGFMGLVPLSAFGLACWSLCVRCARVAQDSDPFTARIADTVIAGFAGIGVGSIFEGYLLGVLNFQIFSIGLYAMAGYACVEFTEMENSKYKAAFAMGYSVPENERGEMVTR